MNVPALLNGTSHFHHLSPCSHFSTLKLSDMECSCFLLFKTFSWFPIVHRMECSVFPTLFLHMLIPSTLSLLSKQPRLSTHVSRSIAVSLSSLHICKTSASTVPNLPSRKALLLFPKVQIYDKLLVHL